MITHSTWRRSIAAIALVVTTAVTTVATASPASAQTTDIDWELDATTHVAGLNQDLEITGGRFVGSVNLETGELTGDITLPPTETAVDLLGLSLATVGAEVVPVGPVSGTVDLENLTGEITSTFNIRMPFIRPLGSRFINLAGPNCGTATPATVTMSGPIDLVNGSTFTGEFEIPRFSGCGLLTTPTLNLLVAGPGNTFTATASPPQG